MLARIKWYYMNIGPKEVLRSCLMPLVVLGLVVLNGTPVFALMTLGAMVVGFFATAPFSGLIFEKWDQLQRVQTFMRYLTLAAAVLIIAKILPPTLLTLAILILVISVMHGINFWGASHPNMLTERGVKELRKQASKPGSDARPLVFIETSKLAPQRPSTHSGSKLR